MMTIQKTLSFTTHARETLLDITRAVEQCVLDSGVTTGICHVYVQGATAAIMIQENWDTSVQEDVIHLLQKIIPRGVWQHDAQDGNGDAHLKSGLVGPSETIPIIHGKLGLSTWQNLFLCEFDGPRKQRNVVVTIMGQ